jgi:hypothetical protein
MQPPGRAAPTHAAHPPHRMSIPLPGTIYYVPTEEGSHDPSDARPHVVVSPPEQNHTLVTLALISTSNLQATRFNASHVYVDKASPLFGATGLTESSYVYPSRLVVCHTEDLPEPAGKLIDEIPELFDIRLPRALGLGSPVSRPASRRRPALRGYIAMFTEAYADLVSCRYGVVITHPAYSKHRQVQTYVPIFDADEYDTVPPAFIVDPTHGSLSEPVTRGSTRSNELRWTRQLTGIANPLLMVQLVQSAYAGATDPEIARYLPIPVDARTLRQLDEALCAYVYGTTFAEVAARRE